MVKFILHYLAVVFKCPYQLHGGIVSYLPEELVYFSCAPVYVGYDLFGGVESIRGLLVS